MYNPKDIPFALGMVMGVYFICRFVAAFPKPSWKDALWVALSIGFAIGIRVGGLLLIPFLFVAIGIEYVFDWRKNYELFGAEIKRLAIYTVGICIVGYFSGLIFWPFALESPLQNPFTALSEMSNFSVGIRMLFGDKHIMSQNVTGGYIPTWIGLTTPIIILLGMLLSPWLFVSKQYKFHKLLFLFFVALFPWLYIVYKHSPLYDGWRHLLFIYPMLVVISALTFTSAIAYVQNKSVKYVIAGLVTIGLILPARWSIANHPNQVVYFNELAGGIDGAYGYYETDYYMNSIKQAFYKLAKEKDLYNTKDSVIIVTNCIEPMWQYVASLKNPRVVADYVRYRERETKPYTYGIFFSRFIDRQLLQNGYFPPANTIITIKADNTPLAVVTKADPEQNAYKANQYFEAKDYANAVVYYQKALTKDAKNETLYLNYAIALASTGHMDEAINITNEYLKMVPEDMNGYQILVQLYKAIGDMQSAQRTMTTAQSIMQEQEGE
jgi:tetratricopeptide (TPR) repeat protein